MPTMNSVWRSGRKGATHVGVVYSGVDGDERKGRQGRR